MSFATEDLVFSTVEPLMGRLMALIGREAPRPFLRHALRRSDREVRFGQAGPPLRHGDQRSVGGVRRVDVRGLSDAPSTAAAKCAGSSSQEAAKYSRRELDEIVEQAKQLGAAGLVWARAPEGAVTSSALKAAGEDTIRRALEIAKAGPADLLLMAAGKHEPTSKLLGSLRLQLARRENLLDPDEVRVSLGRRLPDVRVGRRGAAPRVHAPPVHVAARKRRGPARDRPGPRSRAGLRPRAERQRDRRRQHQDPRPDAPALDLQVAGDLGRGSQDCGSAFSSTRSSTARRRTAASRSGSTGSVAILCGEPSIREVIAFPETAQAVGNTMLSVKEGNVSPTARAVLGVAYYVSASTGSPHRHPQKLRAIPYSFPRDSRAPLRGCAGLERIDE